jgi:hypothetical protein
VFYSYRNGSSLCIFHTSFLLQAKISLFPIERIKYRVISVRQLCDPLCSVWYSPTQFVLLHLYSIQRYSLKHFLVLFAISLILLIWTQNMQSKLRFFFSKCEYLTAVFVSGDLIFVHYLNIYIYNYKTAECTLMK